MANSCFVFDRFSLQFVYGNSLIEAREAYIIEHKDKIYRLLKTMINYDEYRSFSHLIAEYYNIDINIVSELIGISFICLSNWQETIEIAWETAPNLMGDDGISLKKLSLKGKSIFFKELHYEKISFLEVLKTNVYYCTKYLNNIGWPHIAGHSNIKRITKYTIYRIIKNIKNTRHYHAYQMIFSFKFT